MSRSFAIILAAGGSSRMGQSKALLPVDETPLVMLHIEAVSAYSTVVVVGHQAARVQQAVSGVRCVVNADWAVTHPSDSVRVALAALPEVTGILVTPVDVPPADPIVARALVGLPLSAVPVGEDGLEGHPVWVTGSELARLRQGPVDGGLRSLLLDAQRIVVPGPLGADFDDPDAFAAFVLGRTSR
jgi:CTP:molybdopterin cytidylyltransferase MocA